MLEADSQSFVAAPSVPRGFRLQKFRPAFGGTIEGPWEEGGSQPTPPPPSNTSLPPGSRPPCPPLLQRMRGHWAWTTTRRAAQCAGLGVCPCASVRPQAVAVSAIAEAMTPPQKAVWQRIGQEYGASGSVGALSDADVALLQPLLRAQATAFKGLLRSALPHTAHLGDERLDQMLEVVAGCDPKVIVTFMGVGQALWGAYRAVHRRCGRFTTPVLVALLAIAAYFVLGWAWALVRWGLRCAWGVLAGLLGLAGGGAAEQAGVAVPPAAGPAEAAGAGASFYDAEFDGDDFGDEFAQ